MAERLILLRKSTGEILDYNATYPRANLNEPVSGLDPDLEYLIYHTPFPPPDYDSRIYELVTTRSVTTEPHPVYTQFNQFQVTYSTQKRAAEVIKNSIEGREVAANDRVIPNNKLTKLAVLGLGVAIRYMQGQTLTTKEIAIKDKVLQAATYLWKNDAEVKAKLQKVDDGLEPDIDTGWEETNVIDPPEELV